MKLNKNGTLSTLYCWTYGKTRDKLPQNLCPYFWKLLIAILVFPITWFSFIWGFGDYYKCEFEKKVNYERRTNMFFKRLFTVFGVWIAVIFLAKLSADILYSIKDMDLYTIVYNILFFVFAVLVCVILLALTIAIVVGIAMGKEKIQENETYQEIASIVRERKNSFFENYCPRILWDD